MKELEMLKEKIESLELEEKVNFINEFKIILHELSPFKNEPVDCVLWVKQDLVGANDYNPNAVAPPEMELLKLSIENDGYTQPIVAWCRDDQYEVVDGFHRSKVGKTYPEIKDRLNGYLPVAIIKQDREERGDRIASTIRHNRARGKHRIDAMSDIVVELKRRNWSPVKIGKELGMDADEVLRLTQITGLAEMFSDKELDEALKCISYIYIELTKSLYATEEPDCVFEFFKNNIYNLRMLLKNKYPYLDTNKQYFSEDLDIAKEPTSLKEKTREDITTKKTTGMEAFQDDMFRRYTDYRLNKKMFTSLSMINLKLKNISYLIEAKESSDTIEELLKELVIRHPNIGKERTKLAGVAKI